MQAIMKTRFKFLRNQKGMTLIELLAVVVILGIIAAIAVPAIGSTISKTKTNADSNTEDIIKQATLRYLYDKYPDGDSAGNSVKVSTDLVDNGYLSSNFNAKRQVASGGTTAYFGIVSSTYNATSGWTVNSVSSTTTTQ